MERKSEVELKPILKVVRNVYEIERVNHKDKAQCAHGYVYDPPKPPYPYR